MKILCHQEHHQNILSYLKEFQHIEITIIEKGIETEEIGIYFDYDQLEELKEFLSTKINDTTSKHLIGTKENVFYVIQIEDIVYIEGFGKETFAYTEDLEYKINYRLYQLEELLNQQWFIRINKSMIVNVTKINYMTPDSNGRLILNILNDLSLDVSRVYAKNFKKKIGIR